MNNIRKLAGAALLQLGPHDVPTYLGVGPLTYLYDVDPWIFEDPQVDGWLLDLLRNEIFVVESDDEDDEDDEDNGGIDSDHWRYSFARDALILLAAFSDVQHARENVRRYTDRAVSVWMAGHAGVLPAVTEQSAQDVEEAAQVQIRHQRQMFDTVLQYIQRALTEAAHAMQG